MAKTGLGEITVNVEGLEAYQLALDALDKAETFIVARVSHLGTMTDEMIAMYREYQDAKNALMDELEKNDPV